ncbi:MAG: DUF1365 family protein, partial [Lysobacter sp.]
MSAIAGNASRAGPGHSGLAVGPTASLASAVYEGVVHHRRHAPHPHAFRYRMAQLYLDLDEI